MSREDAVLFIARLLKEDLATRKALLAKLPQTELSALFHATEDALREVFSS